MPDLDLTVFSFAIEAEPELPLLIEFADGKFTLPPNIIDMLGGRDEVTAKAEELRFINYRQFIQAAEAAFSKNRLAGFSKRAMLAENKRQEGNR